MAHYMSNHVAVCYGDIFDEMIALSQALGFKIRVWGTQWLAAMPRLHVG